MTDLSKIVAELRKHYDDVRAPWRPKVRFDVEPVFAVCHSDLRTLLAAAEAASFVVGEIESEFMSHELTKEGDESWMGSLRDRLRDALTESEAEHGA
jgi:hypothetical protein